MVEAWGEGGRTEGGGEEEGGKRERRREGGGRKGGRKGGRRGREEKQALNRFHAEEGVPWDPPQPEFPQNSDYIYIIIIM